jgi:hypothetical protein
LQTHWLRPGQRIAVARVVRMPWKEIVEIEGMPERTLRYHLRRWQRDLAHFF